jgi:ATP-dependent DNA helicase RecQ
MPPVTSSAAAVDAAVLDVTRRYWGYDTLRPLQAEAIRAGIDRRDSLVVMPTGGGKSLCYQVPPAVAGRLDVVVSPLIALMKDQVDGLRACGYPAVALHSGLTGDERAAAERAVTSGDLHLVFVAPERLVTPWFMRLLERRGVRTFAIDEAHCISHWGHDFRPEYRQLARLKHAFPDASVHAYTATATERVREDIVRQLELDDPAVLVGRFDRPNLVYRIVTRVDSRGQVLEVIRRHAGEAVIVYCLTRRDTESVAGALRAEGVEAEAYHAGLEPGTRRRIQDAFAAERLDVVVATVAFGMGIDRSNVRCVVHAAMPKSIEAYQQETGRAGRDGLEAECVLLYSPADAMRWESLVRRSADEGEADETVVEASLALLRDMQRLCGAMTCRHRALSEYFGQAYGDDGCGACDVCLGEVEDAVDGTTTARKILSCVARVGQRFGAGHVADVLRGADTEMIRRCGHETLSTYGLLQGMPRRSLMSMILQLVDQGVLARTTGDRPVLHLNDASLEVLRDERAVRLVEPKTAAVRRSRADTESWEGVDRDLFETLRGLRRELARERQVPPYVIFSDATLRELARLRPDTADALRAVHGIGEKKLADLGPVILETIEAWCREHGPERDVGV